jgi:hypothetical protein
MTINQDDRDFLESHKVYFEQAKMKFLHGFSPWVMDRFNAIFVKYVQPGYVLTPWCSECVIDMVTKLGDWYQLQKLKESVTDAGISFRESNGAIIVAQSDGAKTMEIVQTAVEKANEAFMNFVFPDDLDTITFETSNGVVDATIKKKAGRPKKKK